MCYIALEAYFGSIKNQFHSANESASTHQLMICKHNYLLCTSTLQAAFSKCNIREREIQRDREREERKTALQLPKDKSVQWTLSCTFTTPHHIYSTVGWPADSGGGRLQKAKAHSKLIVLRRLAANAFIVNHSFIFRKTHIDTHSHTHWFYSYKLDWALSQQQQQQMAKSERFISHAMRQMFRVCVCVHKIGKRFIGAFMVPARHFIYLLLPFSLYYSSPFSLSFILCRLLYLQLSRACRLGDQLGCRQVSCTILNLCGSFHK